MNLNQLTIHNLAPRGIRGTCVPTSICFVTGACYQDVEHLIVREQPKVYRPDLKSSGGVRTHDLLKNQRRLFGHMFTKIEPLPSISFDFGQFKKAFRTGTYLVCVPHHVFVVKDSEVYDLSTTRDSTKVISVWKVEKC